MLPLYYTDTKDKKEITKEEAIKKHRQLWGYIAAEIGNNNGKPVTKQTAFLRLFPGEQVQSDCFLCEYNEQQKRKTERCCKSCEYCPLCDRDYSQGCLNGLLAKFNGALSIAEAREYALRIASLSEVDKRSEQEKLYDNLKEIYNKHFTFGCDRERKYVWLLGRKIIKLLDKHKDIDFDFTLFGIEVKEDISSHTTILLCRKVGEVDE